MGNGVTQVLTRYDLAQDSHKFDWVATNNGKTQKVTLHMYKK
jgi:hypothetical protein